jgi:hypothetical protein
MLYNGTVSEFKFLRNIEMRVNKPHACCIESEIKAMPVAGPGGLEGLEILRIPHCLDIRLTNGGKFFSLTRQPSLFFPER